MMRTEKTDCFALQSHSLKCLGPTHLRKRNREHREGVAQCQPGSGVKGEPHGGGKEDSDDGGGLADGEAGEGGGGEGEGSGSDDLRGRATVRG